MIPNSRIEKSNTKSRLDALSLIEKGECNEALLYSIIYFLSLDSGNFLFSDVAQELS